VEEADTRVRAFHPGHTSWPRYSDSEYVTPRSVPAVAFDQRVTQLAMRWHTPLRLVKFLDDAHKRNVLRTVGPVYQFRHARLQDRLAGASHGSGNDSNTTSRLTAADNQPGHEL